MYAHVRLYSKKSDDISKFLTKYFSNENLNDKNNVFNEMYSNIYQWENIYSNPVEIATILGVFIDNKDDYSINMWVSFDAGFFINVTKNNADNIIKYLYERYPY